jgi:hypothetical protein
VLQFLSNTWVWVGGLSVASFLILFWTLRGAPMGQEVEEETAGETPRARYRDLVVAASVAALVLIAIGGYVATSHSILASLPLFGLGFGLVLYLIATNRRYRHASSILRRVVQFSNLALGTSLLAGVLIVGNVLAFKYGGRPIDFTRDRSFTLSELTVNQLKSLDRPVRFTVVFGQGEVRARVVQLLDLYKKENPAKVTVEAIHPFYDVSKFEDLRKQAPEIAVALGQGGGIVVEYGEGKTAERLVVNGSDLFAVAPQRPGEPTFQTDFKGEDAVTSAMVRLRGGKKPLIVFITGHGEPPTDVMDPNKPGLGVFHSRLTAMGANVAEINLLYREVPSEASLAIVAAPKGSFQPAEITRLKAYVARGGRLLLLAGADARESLNDWLAEYKVELARDRIVEPKMMAVRGQPFLLMEYLGRERHPIVDSLARLPVALPNSSPLTILSAAKAPVGSGAAVDLMVDAKSLVRTTNESWAENDPSNRRVSRDPKEPQGPFNVGVAVSVAKTGATPSASRTFEPRLVVFGSPNMADNMWIVRVPTNIDLLMNAVHWLRGREELMGIQPKTHVALTLIGSRQELNALVLVPTFSAMFFIIGLGVVAYLSRRI